MARRSYDRMYKNYNEVENEERKTPLVQEEIKVEEKKVEEPKKTSIIRGKVIGGLSLNVRKQPSTDGEIINSLKNGEKIVIVDDSYADWYKLQSPEGFVMKKFVEII